MERMAACSDVREPRERQFKALRSSFQRKLESSFSAPKSNVNGWIPAFAGMTEKNAPHKRKTPPKRGFRETVSRADQAGTTLIVRRLFGPLTENSTLPSMTA